MDLTLHLKIFSNSKKSSQRAKVLYIQVYNSLLLLYTKWPSPSAWLPASWSQPQPPGGHRSWICPEWPWPLGRWAPPWCRTGGTWCRSGPRGPDEWPPPLWGGTWGGGCFSLWWRDPVLWRTACGTLPSLWRRLSDPPCRNQEIFLKHTYSLCMYAQTFGQECGETIHKLVYHVCHLPLRFHCQEIIHFMKVRNCHLWCRPVNIKHQKNYDDHEHV